LVTFRTHSIPLADADPKRIVVGNWGGCWTPGAGCRRLPALSAQDETLGRKGGQVKSAEAPAPAQEVTGAALDRSLIDSHQRRRPARAAPAVHRYDIRLPPADPAQGRPAPARPAVTQAVIHLVSAMSVLPHRRTTAAGTMPFYGAVSESPSRPAATRCARLRPESGLGIRPNRASSAAQWGRQRH
jgi:hypothetical protein